jgi:acetyltransferase-like isoleucine patch superfamily enzyme/folate-dependent phosphoribosylglycinamide formyltransferase PurN
MKIGLITYDTAHLKTQQVFYKLLKKKYKITFFVSKFLKFKPRVQLFKHRPNQIVGPNVFQIAKKYKIKIHPIEDMKKFKDIEFFLICGSRIIDKKYIIKNKIINCHSGLIPMTRGLDGFKWSIINNNIMGNTLHFIDKNVDLGKVISHKFTAIFKNDNYKKFSTRHYNNEIDMLVNFEQYIKKPLTLKFKLSNFNMRMPKYTEKDILKKFESYKKNFLINNTEKSKVKIIDVKFGKNVKIVEPVNIYGGSIGDNVTIGPFVEIQSNSTIGNRTRIQSHSFICELVTIGSDCFVGHGVMFINDKFDLGSPANRDKSLWKETFISDKVSIGSNATILPVKICSNTIIGAGAVVTKDISVSGVYAGNPAKLIRKL